MSNTVDDTNVQARIDAAVREALERNEDSAARAQLDVDLTAARERISELEATVAEITAQAEFCTAEREQFRAAVAASEATLADLRAAADAAAAEAAAAERAESRVAEVKALNLFPEKDVDDMRDALAAHADEAYASILSGYKAAAGAAAARTGSPLSERAGLDTTAGDALGGGSTVSAASDITRIRYGSRTPVAAQVR